MTIYTARFIDGPLQGQFWTTPNFEPTLRVPILGRIEWPVCEGTVLPGIECGVYHWTNKAVAGSDVNHIEVRYTYRGVNDMNIADNITRITGHRPLTLKHVVDYDEVIIDGATLDHLIRSADCLPRSAVVSIWVDGEPIVSEFDGSETTVNIPVRKAGKPHQALLRVSRR